MQEVGYVDPSTMTLTVGEDPRGRGKLAIVTTGGHPQRNSANCVVLTLEIVPDETAAREWFETVKEEQPWIRRS